MVYHCWQRNTIILLTNESKKSLVLDQWEWWTLHNPQAGFLIRTFDADWGSSEFSEDKHNEELYWKGEVDPDSFIHSPSIIRPEHFQCLFLIMGSIISLGLPVLLWDILSNPSFKFYSLMLAGLSACLLITFANIYFFSAALLRPISTEIETNFGNVDILTGEYEIDRKILMNNKTVALAIIGYGSVTSFIFIFIAMIRSLGNKLSHI